MQIMADAKTSTTLRRRAHSAAFKRDLVACWLEPGASVSAIALDAGITANLLFAWRRAYLRSASAVSSRAAAPEASGVVLLPVEVVTPGISVPMNSPSATASRPGAGSIKIELGGARIRLRGAVDATSLRCVFELSGPR